MDMADTPTISMDLRDAGARTEPVVTASGRLRVLSAERASKSAFVEQWQALASEACEPNPFFEPWFVLPSLNHCREGQTVTIKAFFVGDKLKGLFPVARSGRYYGYPIAHATGWLHDNAFCGVPLIASGYERSFWRACFDHFDRRARTSLFLHLPQLPGDGPLNRALEAELAATNRTHVIVEETERACLHSNLSSEEYYARAMSTKKRKELRRQHKRLSEEGELAFERSCGNDDLRAWISDFLALEAAGWKGEAGSALECAPKTRAFFANTLSAASEAGKLERLALRLDGKPIAMLANFVTSPGVYSFKTTFDENFSRFSPGLLLQLENLALLDRDDIQWADSCAVEGHSMIERLWREKRRIVSRNVAIGGLPRRALFKALMAYETRDWRSA